MEVLEKLKLMQQKVARGGRKNSKMTLKTIKRKLKSVEKDHKAILQGQTKDRMLDKKISALSQTVGN